MIVVLEKSYRHYLIIISYRLLLIRACLLSELGKKHDQHGKSIKLFEYELLSPVTCKTGINNIHLINYIFGNVITICTLGKVYGYCVLNNRILFPIERQIFNMNPPFGRQQSYYNSVDKKLLANNNFTIER